MRLVVALEAKQDFECSAIEASNERSLILIYFGCALAALWLLCATVLTLCALGSVKEN